MKKELRDKIYSMSNSFLPLDMFFNDIEDIKDSNYNKEQAYKDLEIIADFILDLQQEDERNKAEAKSQHKSFIDCFKTNLGLIVQCHITSNALKLACEELKSGLSDPNSKFYTMQTEDIFEYFISEGQKK